MLTPEIPAEALRAATDAVYDQIVPKSLAELSPRHLPDQRDEDIWPGILPGRWELASCEESQRLHAGADVHVWSSLTDPEGDYGRPQVATMWGSPDGRRPIVWDLALYDRQDRTKVIRCIHARYVPLPDCTDDTDEE